MFILLLDKDGKRVLINSDYVIAIRELSEDGVEVRLLEPDSYEVLNNNVMSFEGMFQSLREAGEFI